MKLTLHRLSECILDAPTLNVESRPNGSGVNAGYFGPRRNCLGFAFECKQSARSPVSGLFRPCSPFAISGFIIAIVINALNAVRRRWSWSHIGQKVFKPAPSFTDLNSTTPVVFIARVSITSASGVKKTPNAMFWSACQFVGDGTKLLLFPLQASATFCISKAKPFSWINLLVPAFAKTKPLCSPVFGSLRFKRNNPKPSKCLAFYVLERVIHMAKTMTDMPAMSTLSKNGH